VKKLRFFACQVLLAFAAGSVSAADSTAFLDVVFCGAGSGVPSSETTLKEHQVYSYTHNLPEF
jgi:hypothetical protein